ncbi:MAG: flagellar assembly protein FliH [Proteobacteria bacterium]|uniref:FliH/SctL family protein n=1 Tax=Aquabacterium sp. TaxID=1872578 RepID=UPI0035C6E5D7|nr:flagellar assembly protein FliH [Pseudomonadota bacterium]
MNTSKPPGRPGVPPAANGNGHGSGNGQSNPYARFIPREELGNFAAWSPQTLEKNAADNKPDVGVRKPTLAERAAAEMRPSMKPQSAHHAPQATGHGNGQANGQANGHAKAPVNGALNGQAQAQAKTAPRRPVVGGMPGQAEAQEREAARAAEAAAAPAGPPVEELLAQARQEGYQDGYRNGLAALESYKQTQAAQMAAYMSDQVGALASDFHQRLESLEQQLAGRIAGVALELARQVVRTELRQSPELVVDVAEQALGTLLASARQVIVRLNPEDHALAQAQLSEMLAARGARLVPDAGVLRGGCVVESDIAVVDATVEARWARAAASLGYEAPWHGGREAHSLADAHPLVSEEDLDDAADVLPMNDPARTEDRA